MRLTLFFALMIAVITPNIVLAGSNIVTRHFNVNGVCEQCKSRIENAAYVKGVRFADWDVQTHDLTVKYDSTKTSPEIILKSVAKAGHDNEMYKAEKDDYDKIAKCCRYRSGTKKH